MPITARWLMSNDQAAPAQPATTGRSDDDWHQLSWEEKKQRRLELDDYRCCNCRETGQQLHVHHIFPESVGGTDNIQNLRTYCHDCHTDIHSDGQFPSDFSQHSIEAPYVPMVETLREFIGNIGHPMHRCIILLLAKTGIGVSELCGLDLSDVRLRRNPLSYSGIGPRRRRVPNHVTIPPSNTEGIPGARGARLTETKIPLDRELASALRAYLHIRPDDPPSPDGQPLFLSTSRNHGQPLSSDTIHSIVTRHARDTDLYEDGAGRKQNLTPRTLFRFFKERYLGQPAVRDYIVGDRDTMPMRFDRLATDFKEGVPTLDP